MTTIIAGSRTVTDYTIISDAVIASGFYITRVISGGARGADRLGERWGMLNSIPVTVVQADWQQYGGRAGMMRNAEMAKVADGLIAVWNGASRGTRNMIEIAKQKGLMVYVHRF